MSLTSWLCRSILKLGGWSVDITVPDFPKCIICVAPHTSNWDFFIGKLAYGSVGRRAGFLMKDTWFFFPLGCLLRAIGGVAVPRSGPKRGSLVDFMVGRFRESDRMAVAITPEGTRSLNPNWHTGFLRIALEAGVPVVLGAIDFPTRRVVIETVFEPTGDIAADIAAVKAYYRPFRGLHPENFSAE